MLTFSSRGATVKVDMSAVERVRKRLQQRAARVAADRIERRAQIIVSQAKAQWGVDTGRGRASLRVIRQIQGTSLTVSVVSDDPRVPFQRPRGSRRTFWQILIAGPLRRATKSIADEVAKGIAKDVKGG